jgi:uncharacterized coiled-coil DUF342 family protein
MCFLSGGYMENQEYLQTILEKFNVDQNDPCLSDIEKKLLGRIRDVQQEISGLSQEIDKLNAEIKERQEKGNSFVQQIVHKQGQSQGLLDSLIALRKE